MPRELTTAQPLPFFYIGKEETTQRINRYITQKHNLLSRALGKADTMSVWYSKEHIEKLLDEINFAGGDGIRISFGTYDASHPEFAGQLCLLMNTTRAKETSKGTGHVNVILENEPDFAERSSQPRDVIIFPGDDPDSGTPRDFNFGSPCPPRCDEEFPGGE